MGADMQTYIEVYSKNDGKWYYVAKGYAHRWYEMFGRIGGVRAMMGNEAYHERGIPENACWEIKMKHFSAENGYHGMTYYTFDEFKKTVLDYEIKWDEDDEDEEPKRITMDNVMGCDIPCWSLMIKKLVKRYGAENIRLTFIFDS